RQASQSKDRHFIVAEPFGELGGDTGKLDCTRAYRIIAQDACWLTRRPRNEGLGAARLVILPRQAGEINVELPPTAIETLAVVSAADGLLAPDERIGHSRPRWRRAAASKAGVGLGGASSSASTRLLSRRVSTMRSAPCTTASAAGRAARIMKLVRSKRSWAAAAVSRRFSSLVARSSIRPFLAAVSAISWLQLDHTAYCTDHVRTRAETRSQRRVHSRSHNPQRRIVELARKARRPRGLGEAQAHQRVASCTDQVVAQFDDLAGIAVIQAKLLEPVGQVTEDFQPAGLHALEHH